MRVPKPQHKSHKALKKECDKLWAECVKARAGHKSEYSKKAGRQIGGDSILCAHHINGKGNYRLRYDIELNGICLTYGEHAFIAHRADRVEAFREFVKIRRGKDIFERLELLKGGTSKLWAVKAYLEQELAKLKGE